MAETVTMPKLGFDMAEGKLVRWLKKEGESVAKGDILAEIETDKATVEVESSFSGLIHQRLVDEGALVPVGTPLAVIAAPGETVEALKSDKTIETVSTTSLATPLATTSSPVKNETHVETNHKVSGLIKASPLAKRIARENGLPLNGVNGTGPGGRIVKRDVEQVLAESIRPQTLVQGMGQTIIIPPSQSWTSNPVSHADERIPLTRLRSIIARRMVESKQAPHFYVTHDFDMGALMLLRKEVNEFLPEEERLSVNDFVVKGVSLALREFPNINASFAGDEIIRHGAVNIGVAVALDNGLMTVVCRDADMKPLRIISREIREMAARARAGKVKPEDIEGSTFSISNLGMFDVEDFAAIINAPEGAILAVASAKQVPVVKDGTLTVGTRMKATLSADHRVTDGTEAARFLQTLANYLEKPASLLI